MTTSPLITTTPAAAPSPISCCSSCNNNNNVSMKMKKPMMMTTTTTSSSSLAVSFSPLITSTATGTVLRRRSSRMISCEVALESDATSSSLSSDKDKDVDPSSIATEKIGARVRVKVPLKVHHIPRVAEVDITGMEGVLKQYVGVWKGKRISANLPYKIEFLTHIEGRGPGPVKFFAHLKEDEFEYL